MRLLWIRHDHIPITDGLVMHVDAPSEPLVLEVFTDYVCPWCYLVTRRIERLQQSFHLDVRRVFFPLHPDTPPEGLPLVELFRGRNLDLDAMQQRMQALMDSEGLPYGGVRTHTYNSRLAQELGKWADTLPGFTGIHDALYRAYFVDGRNLAEPGVLLDGAHSVGLPAEDARRVVEERSFKDMVDEDWRRARQYGVTGVPTFVANGRGLAGAQPYETLAQLLTEAGARSR